MEGPCISFNTGQTLPLWGLPTKVQSLIMDIADKRQIPVEFALAPALVAACTAMGSKACVEFNSYKTYMNLWALVVGRSGSNKSSPMSDLMAPIKEIDSKLNAQYQAELENARKREMADKGQVRYSLMIPKLQIVMQDCTPEGRAEALFFNKHGVVWIRDEIAAMISDFGRYSKNGEFHDLLSIYDNNVIKVNRRTQETIYVERPYMPLIGGIQPGIIKECFNNSKFFNSGFLQRFLVFWPALLPKRVFTSEVCLDPGLFRDWSVLLNKMHGHKDNIPLQMSKGAVAAYAEFYNRSSSLIEKADSDYECAVWSKLQVTVIKLAGIAAVMNAFCEDVPTGPMQIMESDMNWAVAVVPYFHDTQMRLYKIAEGGRGVSGLTNTELIALLLKRFPDIVHTKLAELTNLSVKTITRAAVLAKKL